MPPSPSLFEPESHRYKPDLEGLELSNILFRSPNDLTANPLNDVFDAMKDEAYREGLKHDIARHGIVNALIITKAGLIIEGHSRWQIALALQLKEVPVRIILQDVSDQLLKERLYLGNLHRFEISKDVRTKMYADLYPHIFYDANASIPDELAKQMGLSTSQVRNEKQLLLMARTYKEEQGDTSPLSLKDIAAARNKMNQARRERERLKRMQWQQVDAMPTRSASRDQEPMPLFLSHEEPEYQATQELDILEEYKLLSQDSRSYAIYTKDNQLIASLDPQTFQNIEELDTFAKQLISIFHQLKQDRNKKSETSPASDV
ncbi:ParB/RepB/Spo0J family partition protein (plasmid) [Entomospira entomophila]|uniref:ParB N-terminal domain-containing protein n=1 Tax=Entomospira entomophila TaxID=2719988 RepID=A0A968GD90_9SPIO|nr:ParB/RepB/Spo0J family partition protein [Entomospira entomophilus]NIZ41453.1 ParB N-terminal domain-containing protein [Entomospira entomophilus]WDI36287.1 ParB/RepB/Spo0J family partition protein [Entomospira entomophilus]